MAALFAQIRQALAAVSSSPTRLLQYTINNAFRPFLKDELQKESLQLGLNEGHVNIENVNLNETTLNESLKTTPIRVIAASLGSLKMEIPWRNGGKGIKLTGTNLKIRISFGQPDFQPMTSLVDSQRFDDDDYADELGISEVEKLLEEVLHNLNITLVDSCIFLEDPSFPPIQIKVDKIELGKTSTIITKISGLRIIVQPPEGAPQTILSMMEESQISANYETTSSGPRLNIVGRIGGESLAELDHDHAQILSRLASKFTNSPAAASTVPSKPAMLMEIKFTLSKLKAIFSNGDHRMIVNADELEISKPQDNSFEICLQQLKLLQSSGRDGEPIELVHVDRKAPSVPAMHIKLMSAVVENQSIIDVHLEMGTLVLSYHPEAINNLGKIMKRPHLQDEHQMEGKIQLDQSQPSDNLTLFSLRSPSIHVLVNFPTTWLGIEETQPRESITLDLLAKSIRVNTIPTDQATVLALQFESFKSYLGSKHKTRPLLDVWTPDASDVPRIQITMQTPNQRSCISSMIIDLQQAFETPRIFSFFSENFLQITKPDIVDLEKAKQNSTMIIDVILPHVQMDLHNSDLILWQKIASEFSGEATYVTTIMASIGKGTAYLRDGSAVIYRANEEPQAPTENEFRLELFNFRVFNSAVQKKEVMGSFTLLNADDVKLVSDDDNNILIRKTPQLLRLDEVYCSPFAINLPKFSAHFSGILLWVENVTFGTNPTTWKNFFKLLLPPSSPAVQVENSEVQVEVQVEADEPEVENTESRIELSVERFSIYYQPTCTIQTMDVYVTPPRAIFSGISLKYQSVNGEYIITADGLNLWIKEDFHHLKNQEIFLNLCHPDPKSHFKSKCLIPIISLNGLVVSSKKEENMDRVIVDFLEVDGRRNPLEISVRPDSYETFCQTIELLSHDLVQEFAAEPTQEQADVRPPQNRPEIKKEKPKEGKLGKQEEVIKPVVMAEPKKDKAILLFDEEMEDPEPNKKRNSMEEDWHVIDSEEMEDPTDYFPPMEASMQLEVINLFVIFLVQGGHDWENEQYFEKVDTYSYRKNGALHSRADSVEIQVEIPRICLEFYPPDCPSDWRLSAQIERMVVTDSVRTSHHRHILTFTRSDNQKLTEYMVSLLLEQGRYSEEDPLETSFKFKLNVAPLRLYLDQSTLTFLFDFFTYSSHPQPPTDNKDPSSDVLLFEYFDVGTIDSVIDYKPRASINQVWGDFRLGNNIWAFKTVELNKAHIVFNRIKLHKVRRKETIIQELLYKNLRQSTISNYFYGTHFATPVQIGINIGSAVVDLIKTPIEEYNKGGNVLVGLGAGASSLVSRVTVELLNIGASSAITIKRGLAGIDKALSGARPPRDAHFSPYANQPRNFTQGAKQAASSIRSGFTNSIHTVREGGILRLPSAIIQPAIGGMVALSSLTLGLRNTMDGSAWENAQEKYKKPPKAPSRTFKHL